MRPWKLKSVLDKDKPIFGLGFGGSANPETLEVAGELGLDFAGPDMEHYGVFEISHLYNCIRAADVHGMPCIVRVPEGSINDHVQITQVLDAGAEGILMAHCNTKEDAIKAVQATKYAPEGIRGATSGVRRPCAYGVRVGNIGEWYKESNKNVLTCLLIEEQRGVDNIEEIVSVKGVTAVWPGLRDMSVSMGLWGVEPYPKAVWDNYEKVVAAAKRKGVAVMCGGQVPGFDKDPIGALTKFIKEDGGRIIPLGNDPKAAKSIADKVKKSL